MGAHQQGPQALARQLEGAVKRSGALEVVENPEKDVIRQVQKPERPRQRHSRATESATGRQFIDNGN